MDHKKEMEAFTKHLVKALPLMEADEDIGYLVAQIGLEYIDWANGDIEDMGSDDYDERISAQIEINSKACAA